MGFWFRILGGLVAVLVLAVAALVAFPPVGLIQERIAAEARAQTGLSLQFEGTGSLSLIGGTFRLPPVTLARADAQTETSPLGRIGGTDGQFSPMALLSRRVLITELVLSEPMLDLPALRSFADKKAVSDGPAAERAGASVSIDRVRVDKGALQLGSAPSGDRLMITDLALTVEPGADGQSANGAGQGRYRDRVVALTFALNGLQTGGQTAAGGAGDLAGALVAALTTKADGLDAELRLDGQFGLGDQLSYDGKADIAASDAARMAEWLGLVPASDTARWSQRLGRVDAKGTVALRGTAIDAKDLAITTGAVDVAGGLKITPSDQGITAPAITGALTVNRLDIAALVPGLARPERAAAAELQPLELEFAPRPAAVRGFLDGTEPLFVPPAEPDFAPLAETEPAAGPRREGAGGGVDIAFTMPAGAAPGLGLGDGVVRLTDDGSGVRLATDRMAFAGGTVAGHVRLATGGTGLSGTLTLSGVEAEQALGLALARKLVSGRTNAEIAFRGFDPNAANPWPGLDAEVTAEARAGALHGFDVKRMLLSPWSNHSYDPRRSTGFDRLVVRAGVAKGLARAARLDMTGGQQARMRALGRVDFAASQMDLLVSAEVIPPPDHVPLSVRARGPFAKPRISLSFSSVPEEPKIAAARLRGAPQLEAAPRDGAQPAEPTRDGLSPVPALADGLLAEDAGLAEAIRAGLAGEAKVGALPAEIAAQLERLLPATDSQP